MQKAVMVIAILMVIALALVDFTYKEGPKPDAVYPMANQRIVWTN